MTSNVEAVVGVGGRNPGHANAGLGKDVVDRECDHVLGFDSCENEISTHS